MKPTPVVYYDAMDVINYLVNDHGLERESTFEKLWTDFEVESGTVYSVLLEEFPEFSEILSELAGGDGNFIRLRKYW
jgi:hypothetical protein